MEESKMKNQPLSCLAACLACLSGFPLDAAEDVKKPMVVVTATRIQSNTNAITLNAEQIRQSPAQTLPELLSLEAGIFSRSLYGNNAARATIDIRGFGAASSQNTLILLDGRRLNDVDMSAVDFTAIPLAAIERIEIMPGSGAVLYGDGAVGGTINIITRQSGTLGASGYGELSAGSYGERHIDAAVSHGSGLVSYNLMVNGIRSDGYRDNNELDQKNIQLGASLVQNNGEVFIRLGADDQVLGLPGERTVDPTIGLNELRDDRRGANNPDDYAEQDGQFITAGITRFVGEGSEIVIDLGYRDKNQQAFYDDYDFGGAFASYLDSDLATLSLTPRVKTTHTLFDRSATSLIGIDIYQSEYDSDRALNPTTISTPIHQLAIRQGSMALYGQNTMQLNDKNQITLGARVQTINLTASDRLDSTAPGGAFESEAPDLDETDSEHMIELGLQHRHSDSTVIKANIGRSARFATVDEIFELDPISFLRVFSPLEPQTSRIVEIGIDYSQASYQLGARIYHMSLDDEIHFDPNTFTNINLDPTRRQGIELSATSKVTEMIKITGHYAYTRAEFREGTYAGNDIPLVPRNTASISTLWDISTTLQLSMTANHAGKKYFDNDQNNTSAQIPAHDRVDIKLSHRNGPWRITGAVNNLFDEKAFDYGVISLFTPGRYNAYPLPERSMTVTVTREFE